MYTYVNYKEYDLIDIWSRNEAEAKMLNLGLEVVFHLIFDQTDDRQVIICKASCYISLYFLMSHFPPGPYFVWCCPVLYIFLSEFRDPSKPTLAHAFLMVDNYSQWHPLCTCLCSADLPCQPSTGLWHPLICSWV